MAESDSASAAQIESEDSYQTAVGRWEEFYDKIYAYLRHKKLSNKNTSAIETASKNYSVGNDGKVYFTKVIKSGEALSVEVVRDYSERQEICRKIHTSTGKTTSTSQERPNARTAGKKVLLARSEERCL